MPTKRLSARTFYAHVPVDEVQIVKGPMPSRWMEWYEQLQQDPTPITIWLTLKTRASARTFRKSVSLIKLQKDDDRTYQFTVIFGSIKMTGVYHLRRRTGWFNEA